MSDEVALVLSALLLATAATALFSKRVSVSLITLFYSSIMLGVIFTLYGNVLVGLIHIITFAGAVSVMLLTAILMTGESSLDIGATPAKVGIVGGVLLVVAAASYTLLGGLPQLPAQPALQSTSLLQFVWQFRPWDLLILLMVFASSMVVVANLFSRDER